MTGAGSVSAIVTAFNVEPYIGEAVRSLLAQTTPPLEVIVVDDGSSDGTRAILAGLAIDHRVRIITQENAGSSAARNAGARAARGAFLAFLDGDDVAVPDRVERSVAALTDDRGAALIYGSIDLIDERGALLQSRRDSARYQSGSLTRPLRYRNFIPFSTITVRTTVFRELGGFDESIRSSEDWEFLFRLSRRHRIRFARCCLARYRVRGDAKTADIDAKEKAYLAVQQRIFLRELGMRSLPRLAHACRYAGLASLHLRRGDPRSALRLMMRSLSLNPMVLLIFRFEILDMMQRRLRSTHG